jgi:D-alanyl-lipoteichoic acid acyltransferase DltB (MBOAT superfamily)
MLFNSIDFAIFLPIVFIIYWLILGKNYKFQNLLIVVASYIFYSWWDWKFTSLILFSTLIDYLVGIGLSKTDNKKKRLILLWTSIGVNLGFLGFFKYYNFFLDNFITAFTLLGTEFNATSLNVILPVGISFYTFQTLSYTIDVYKRKMEPTNNIVSFAAYVSFFPQLVAGPIERATQLLPQFYKEREFNYNNAVNGLRQILWGLFKKIVIADNCAMYANIIFGNSAEYSGSTLVLGALFFTFQIYGDFSGYSDIAIGTSKLFGFNLMKNFAFPYFSRDIAEFWRRWHISLSTWFRDYLYIPIGGSRVSKAKNIRNIFIIFIVSGFWHGANWTFIVWGALNAIYFLPLLLINKNRHHIEIVAHNKSIPSIKELSFILITFGLTVFAWIFFRAESVTHAVNYIAGIFNSSLLSVPDFPMRREAVTTIVLVCIFILVEWVGRRGDFAIDNIAKKVPKPLRILFYYAVIMSIFWYGGSQQQFIYFQF